MSNAESETARLIVELNTDSPLNRRIYKNVDAAVFGRWFAWIEHFAPDRGLVRVEFGQDADQTPYVTTEAAWRLLTEPEHWSIVEKLITISIQDDLHEG